MSSSQMQAPPTSAPLSAPHPPAGRPNRRLRAGRTFRWVYETMAVFMALVTVLTAVLHEWAGTAICAVAAPAFWGMSRLFKREQLAIYGSQLWERDALGRWRAPLDLDRLVHVAYIRDDRALRAGTISLLLQASAPPETRRSDGASPGERAVGQERQEMRLRLQEFSRRGLERLIAPWVAGRPGIASEELARLFALRAKHPRTAGIRMLFSR